MPIPASDPRVMERSILDTVTVTGLQHGRTSITKDEGLTLGGYVTVTVAIVKGHERKQDGCSGFAVAER